MAFRLPPSLQTEDDAPALDQLRRYFFSTQPGERGSYTGALFDTWDADGTRHNSADRFTSDDLVAITLLSVSVSGRGAYQLLHSRREEFSQLLASLGPDRDLVELSGLPDDWPGWKLQTALVSLPGVGPTTASKLLARKRPRLRPIYDSVVAEVTSTQRLQWDPVRVALRADGAALHKRLVRLGHAAKLDHVSPLRILDVVAWMDGKDKRRAASKAKVA